MRHVLRAHQLQHNQTIHSVVLADQSVHLLVFDSYNAHWLLFSPYDRCEEVGYGGCAFNQRILATQELRPGAPYEPPEYLRKSEQPKEGA